MTTQNTYLYEYRRQPSLLFVIKFPTFQSKYRISQQRREKMADNVLEQNNLGVAHLMTGNLKMAQHFLHSAFQEAKRFGHLRLRPNLLVPACPEDMQQNTPTKRPLNWPELSRDQFLETLKSAWTNDIKDGRGS